MKKIYSLLSVFSLILIFLVSSVSAAEPGYIISNSGDWRDVYSVMLYGAVTEKTAGFLVSTKHGGLILNSIAPGTHIWSITSKKLPYVVGYENYLIANGYGAEEFFYDNPNLELAKLVNTDSFIIVDDSYGYNAISVAPYATVTKSYVLFADQSNIRAIDQFLQGRTVNKMIIYGQVDREVKSTLEKYNPEIINKEGDRFENNIEIVKRYQKVKGQKQAILTNGEFIEREVMSGVEPVIFIGTNNVPTSIREYIQDSDIEVGVLIGNELVGTATYVRRQLGISVFVKFAQGARQPKGAVSQVEALDMFYLPTYNLNLELVSVKYNKATNQLEVTYRNTEDQAVYFQGTYTLRSGEQTQAAGDIEPVFIDGNEVKTLVYDIDSMPEQDLTARIYTTYGESKGAMEKIIDESVQVQVVQVLDRSSIALKSVAYNKGKGTFYITVENTGDVDAYVDLELIDLIIAGERESFSPEIVTLLKAGEQKQIRVKAELEEDDIIDNEIVKIRAYYGEREDSLVKMIEGEFELTLQGADWLFWSLIIIIIILVALIIWKRQKKDKKGNSGNSSSGNSGSSAIHIHSATKPSTSQTTHTSSPENHQSSNTNPINQGNSQHR